MHDHGADRALTRHFFELVGPPAVISHGLSAESTLPGFEIRIIDQHHGDLAFQIDAFEVVPVAFRGLYAVTDEHQRRILDGHRGLSVHGGADGDFIALLQRLGFATERHRGLHRTFDFEASERNGLRPETLAVLAVAARLQTGSLELLDQIRDGFLFTCGIRAAALEGIR